MGDLVKNILEFFFGISQNLGVPSYAAAIIILTILIKLVLLPLNIKQMNSMKGIQEIQPLMADLEKKYGNNPQKKQEEMLKLYQEHHINPMAGCLPLLIQLPIIMVLYRGLLNFVPANPEYYNFFWLTDLSKPDTTIIMPILVAVFTFLQSYTSTGAPKETMQKVMVYGMPLMLGWMAMNFPSGICIYWVVFSIMGILQQVIVNKGLTPLKKQPLADGGKKKADPVTIDVKAEEISSGGNGGKTNKGNYNKNTSKKKH